MPLWEVPSRPRPLSLSNACCGPWRPVWPVLHQVGLHQVRGRSKASPSDSRRQLLPVSSTTRREAGPNRKSTGSCFLSTRSRPGSLPCADQPGGLLVQGGAGSPAAAGLRSQSGGLRSLLGGLLALPAPRGLSVPFCRMEVHQHPRLGCSALVSPGLSRAGPAPLRGPGVRCPLSSHPGLGLLSAGSSPSEHQQTREPVHPGAC